MQSPLVVALNDETDDEARAIAQADGRPFLITAGAIIFDGGDEPEAPEPFIDGEAHIVSYRIAHDDGTRLAHPRHEVTDHPLVSNAEYVAVRDFYAALGAPAAPNADIEAQVKAAEAVLEAIQAHATPRIHEPVTVRDVLQTSHRGPCRMGKRQHLSNRDEGKIRHVYRHCKSIKCPRCAPAAILRPIRATLEAWQGAPIHTHTFATAKDWENSKRGERLRTAFAGPTYARLYSATGEQVIFTPGPFEDGTPVGSDLGAALALAFCAAPATGRRYTKPRTPKVEPDDDTPAEEKPASGWLAAELPHYLTPEMANTLVEQAIGRTLEWTTASTSGYWRSYEVSGLTPEEIDAVRIVLAPHLEAARREQADCRAISREFDTLLQLSALGGSTDAKTYAAAADISASSARSLLNKLHASGKVFRGKDGTAYFYALPAVEAAA